MIRRRIALKGAAATLIAPALDFSRSAEAGAGDAATSLQDDCKPVIIEDGVAFGLPSVHVGQRNIKRA